MNYVNEFKHYSTQNVSTAPYAGNNPFGFAPANFNAYEQDYLFR
jgi:hypothetical protein